MGIGTQVWGTGIGIFGHFEGLSSVMVDGIV